jgi:hypothetical protein
VRKLFSILVTLAVLLPSAVAMVPCDLPCCLPKPVKASCHEQAAPQVTAHSHHHMEMQTESPHSFTAARCAMPSNVSATAQRVVPTRVESVVIVTDNTIQGIASTVLNPVIEVAAASPQFSPPKLLPLRI